MKRHLRTLLASCVSLSLLTACDTDKPLQPLLSDESVQTAKNTSDSPDPLLIQEVRTLATAHGIGPLPAPPHIRPPLVILGQALAFDRILSGGRNISCMTCHVPKFGTGDGKSLAVGEGGTGLGPARSHPDGTFIPRNAPSLYNLAALNNLFWDGRVSVDAAGNFHTPAGAQLTPEMTQVFEFGAVSALAMFPVTSREEMRGHSGNELAAIPDDDFTAIWAGLMNRLGSIEQYRDLFTSAYPGTKFEDMTFAHASNAIAAFLVERLTFRNAPWDRFLAGNDRALTTRQLEGAKTFLTLRCVECHNGPTFSDDQFHNVAVAQIGPGVGNGVAGNDDFGRENVTGNPADRYRFRTSPLRNIELTAPYGHDGAILDLREFIEHYSDSHVKLLAYDPGPLEPALQGTLVPNATDILATRDPIIEGVVIPDDIIDRLMDYMSALTDEAARNPHRVTPNRVPSKLPVDR